MTCISFPFTRVPKGDQIGRPALLDYVLASDILKVSVVGSWLEVPTDHAIICATVSFSVPIKLFRKSTWVVADRDRAVKFLCEDWPAAFTRSSHYCAQEATPQRFFDFLKVVRDVHADHSSCSTRRQRRFPFHLRLLRHKFLTCEPHLKRALSERYWSAKTAYFNSVRVWRLQSDIKKGKCVEKSKKLFRIRALNMSGVKVSDSERIAQLLADSYSTKFGAKDLQRREVLLDFVRRAEEVPLGLDEADVEVALSRCKHPCRLDE